MNLYQIEAEMLTCISEDGEVIDLEKLDALTMERNSKVSNIACWIKDLKAEAKRRHRAIGVDIYVRAAVFIKSISLNSFKSFG